MKLKKIGTEIKFHTRAGKVVGYAFDLKSESEINSYYVVELDAKSSGYLTSRLNNAEDCYVSKILFNVENELDEDNE
jgi:hypothetical protein